ncbi:CDP-diacylglycerol--glycerol-3-phosphate 3-phosphatidyltransferase [Planctomycetota bacterium]
MNLPNAITLFRFIIAPVFLALLWDGRPASLLVALALYALAGISDLLDGFLARRMGQESSFGRMADPFVDKIIICGALIMLIGKTPVLAEWMVAVIVCREFLVTGLRILVESRGEAFGSSSFGKQKMIIQYFAVAALILYIAYGEGLGDVVRVGMSVFIWAAVAFTVVSGALYVRKAIRALGKSA